MLLFLANYPVMESIREGMSQRIVAIDRQLEKAGRAYLFVSHRLFWRKETIEIKKGVIQYRCNLFVHFFFILRLMQSAETLYFHSVINVLPLLPLLHLIRKQTTVVLDAHGVVPEELRYHGNVWKSRFYQFAEKRIFKRADRVITVSFAMTNYFRNKHPAWKGSALHYPILPAHIVNDIVQTTDVDDDRVHVIYSGNLQSWQNVDLMISLIKRNLSERMMYTLLTGQPEEMKKRMVGAGIVFPDDRIAVRSVSPDELQIFYQRAHYGFILRDDMLINRVACPTKMVEYLRYGIVPILKSSHIGDFGDFGYEYIRYEDFSANLPPRKSVKNQELMQRYVAKLNVLDYAQMITGER